MSDVDRAKAFYEGLGWRLDADFADDQGFRIVQFTPHGSACSIQFGSKVTSAPRGSPANMYLVVPDVHAARQPRRAAAAHGQHEARIGREDADWPDWYAEYIVREQASEELPS